MVYIPDELGQADFCGFGDISLDLIFRSLLGCDATDGKTVLRICIGTEVTTTPIHCGSFEDFMINLRRSLEMAADGQIAIRVNFDYYIEGAGLSTCGLCANGFTWEDYANSLFGEDSEGLVWINFGIVCGSREAN